MEIEACGPMGASALRDLDDVEFNRRDRNAVKFGAQVPSRMCFQSKGSVLYFALISPAILTLVTKDPRVEWAV